MIVSYIITALNFLKSNFLGNALIILFCVSILTIILINFLRFQRLVKLVDRIPGPKCSKFLGKILGNLELFWTLKYVDDPSCKLSFT
jgi:hypothetical protein